VVEDTPTGVTAGVAAGCTVFAYHAGELAHTSKNALLAAGASETFDTMQELPNLLR
jgi:beta-phosphoglucomutase-like phosphatase (HAD superfamily)